MAAVSISLIDTCIKIISYYFFDKAWHDFYCEKPKPCVIWLTGLSGSGKTTIAQELMTNFKAKEIVPVMLDGDDIRKIVKQNGFDEQSRKQHNMNVGYIASLFEKQGSIVIVSLISPFEDVRKDIRKLCNKFIEVYVATELATCISRDPKGLYQKALHGELENFTGISSPYMPPQHAELVLDTEQQSVIQCANKIMHYYNHSIK